MIPRNVVRNLSVTLDVPLALMASLRVLQHFGVKQNPFPPSRRLGSNSRIVLLEASFQVCRPAGRGSAIILASAAEHVNEKGYLVLWGPVSHG
jgi:hypothetical protein